ncbi:guanylate kinase [Helicovermis profundi]|uniref:Guanylate kinase n=1 Tax=Helicovermis profundi TaxID=3065157 RepID=A0AAU9EC03_9FIRM|nr:guanylate kinase [Clostridia bacterium S502]
MTPRGLLIVVSGPSGAGKGTICKSLISEYKDIGISVSATTREPRDGEVDGKNYFFLKKEKFQSMIHNDELLEYAKVYQNYYGTPKKFVLDKVLSGEDVLLEIDIQGALQVKEKYPEGIFVFILPPSMEELKNRIINRGSETEDSFKLRYSSALDEMSFIKDYDYFIINDEIHKATSKLICIIEAEKNRIISNIGELINEFKEENRC